MAGTCECGNEPSGPIKCVEFLDLLKTGQLLKRDSAPWSKYVEFVPLLMVILTDQSHYWDVNC